MQFKAHLAASAALALAIYPRRPLRAAVLVGAGTLIDLDHLLLYALQTGDWSVSGALRYDRYRHRAPVRGDSRPRYGPLRSLLHEPLLLLPTAWLLAGRHPALLPAAIGLSLHLLLDYLYWPRDAMLRRRAGGRCSSCERLVGRRLRVRVRHVGGRRQLGVVCPQCDMRGR
jgi:hypothetical protein